MHNGKPLPLVFLFLGAAALAGATLYQRSDIHHEPSYPTAPEFQALVLQHESRRNAITTLGTPGDFLVNCATAAGEPRVVLVWNRRTDQLVALSRQREREDPQPGRLEATAHRLRPLKPKAEPAATLTEPQAARLAIAWLQRLEVLARDANSVRVTQPKHNATRWSFRVESGALQVRISLNKKSGEPTQIAVLSPGNRTQASGHTDPITLVVMSDTPRYWRGRTFARYTGSSWVNPEGRDEALRPMSAPDSRGRYAYAVASPSDSPLQKTRRVTNHFRPAVPTRGSLYHAGEPLVVYAAVPDLFRIESEVSTATAEDLNRSSTDYPEEIARTYLDPGPSNPALRQLARQATRNARSPFEKAEAIREFVSRRCLYTREARPVPPGKDAAEFFLSESRKGYCDQFATATTLLCRYAGLPTRIATGFAPGTRTAPGSRTYVLRNSDRHAWTEVYFAGYGWVPFDATENAAPAPYPHPFLEARKGGAERRGRRPQAGGTPASGVGRDLAIS